jgi:putative transposase
MSKGIGHQLNFYSQTQAHRWAHGGSLRQKRLGRGRRPLSTKDPLHCVFKFERRKLRIGLRSYRAFQLINKIIKTYSHKFSVKIEQISIQRDHIHVLVRASKRSSHIHFFRVAAGQIAQQFDNQSWVYRVTDTPARIKNGLGLWKLRPFSRIVRGWRAYKIVRNYIQLNEKEVLGEIPYRKTRLKGLSSSDWRLLWS